ncbi:MAG: ComF family protein [Clostridia bacterium]|nr:ComF family protein [Clostridia bacterium]
MKLKELFLAALYPEDVACCVCNKEAVLNSHGVCRACEELIVPAPGFSLSEAVSGASAGIKYNDAAADMVHRFKYFDGRYLGKNLASFMTLPQEWQADVIIPVPLHPERLKERGYNQSLILAGELSGRYGIPVRDDLLKRIRNTLMQSMTSREERRANVKDAFSASKRCRGISIILVDDVITSGSTSEECAKALKAAGADKVYVIAACYAGGQES